MLLEAGANVNATDKVQWLWELKSCWVDDVLTARAQRFLLIHFVLTLFDALDLVINMFKHALFM